MKRFAFPIFLWLIVSLFFSTPLVGNAAVTEADFTKITGEIKSTLLSTEVIRSTASTSPSDATKSAYIDEVISLATLYFNTVKTQQSLTVTELRVNLGERVLRKLQTDRGRPADLRAISNLAERERREQIADMATSYYGPMGVFFEISVADNQLANGQITPAERATAIQNATQNNASRSQALNETAAAKAASLAGKCTNFFTSSLIDCIDVFVTWIIKTTLLQIAGFSVWVTANAMNYAIKIGILEFARWAPDTLYPIWLIIRQIVSLFVVFAGLWLGFMYIIDKGDQFKKYIPWVVVFALFVNFSYPLARTLTDVSNVISLNIYAGAFGSEVLTADITSSKNAGGIIRDQLGLISLVDLATGKTNSSGFLNSIDTVPGALIAVIFLFYAAYVFFMATALIVTRTAVLVFIIIASPILFVDSVIPKLGDEAVKLRKIFIEQLMVAPVFMIMLALTLKFLDVFKKGPLGGDGVGQMAGATGQTAIVVFFNLLMMLIMLHIMLKVTKSLSGNAGLMATNFVGKVGGFVTGAAVGAATGGTGLLARATLGRAAAAAGNSPWVQRNQTNVMGRGFRNLTNSLANSTFDARNSAVAQRGFSRLGISSGMGAGSKTGYTGDVAARKKDRVERLKNIGTYANDVYDDNGELLNAKGDSVETAEAKEARTDYIQKAGGVMFGKKDMKGALTQAANAQEKEQVGKVISTYKESDGAERQKVFAQQNAQTQAKLLKVDAKEAREENKEISKTISASRPNQPSSQNASQTPTRSPMNLETKEDAENRVNAIKEKDRDEKIRTDIEKNSIPFNTTESKESFSLEPITPSKRKDGFSDVATKDVNAHNVKGEHLADLF